MAESALFRDPQCTARRPVRTTFTRGCDPVPRRGSSERGRGRAGAKALLRRPGASHPSSDRTPLAAAEDKRREKERVPPSATASANGTRRPRPEHCTSTTAATRNTSESSRLPTGPSSTSGATSRREPAEIYFAHEARGGPDEPADGRHEFFPLSRRDRDGFATEARPLDRRSTATSVGDRGKGSRPSKATRGSRAMEDASARATSEPEILADATAGRSTTESTLIGGAVETNRSSKTSSSRSSDFRERGDEQTDLALLTRTACGPSASRGSPIDVAHRYFGHAERKFVIATRRHIQTPATCHRAPRPRTGALLVDAAKACSNRPAARPALLAAAGASPRPLRQQNDLVDYTRRFLRRDPQRSSASFAAKLEITDTRLRADLGARPATRGDALAEHALVRRPALLGHSRRSTSPPTATWSTTASRPVRSGRSAPSSAINRGFAGSCRASSSRRRGDGAPSNGLEIRRDRHRPRARSPSLPPMAVTLLLETRSTSRRRHDLPSLQQPTATRPRGDCSAGSTRATSLRTDLPTS